MKFKVHMLAFQPEYCVREVDVPNEQVRKELDNADTSTLEQAEESVGFLLEAIFHWGQNEMQNVRGVCSVSMGDVAEIKGKYFLCLAVGWSEMNPEQFEAYKAADKDQRYSLARAVEENAKRI